MKKAEARDLLEQGFWVRLGCTATGHTRAKLTESAGIEWAKKECGDSLEIAEREGWGRGIRIAD